MKIAVDAGPSGHQVCIGGAIYPPDAAEAIGERILSAARAARAMAAQEAAAPLDERVVLFLVRAQQASARTIAACLHVEIADVAAALAAQIAAGRVVVVGGFDVPVYRAARAAR